ncbi:MAG: DUF3267 domain-containing protein [Lachnospiraceae bacterium]|jgi:hypothetical protein|nr:DUF3267 domain-containing protein [Lachnospiraceae bacterium]
MIIPGVLISLATFPGVIIHELAHQIFCMLCGLKVYEIKYFQMSNPNGYVVHESTDHPLKVFLTCMGPFFINSVLGIVILLPASIELMTFREYTDPLNLLLGWLGFSILMHAFPSRGDAKVMICRILKNPYVSVGWKALAAPFVGLIYICSVGRIFWLDLLYAGVLAMLVPWVLVQLL